MSILAHPEGIKVTWRKSNGRIMSASGDIRHENDDWLMLKNTKFEFPIPKFAIVKREVLN